MSDVVMAERLVHRSDRALVGEAKLRQWRASLGCAAVLAAAVVATACQVPAGPERALEGKDIYERHCARCHGLDGKGVASVPGARDLSNAAFMAARSDDQLRGVIMRGVPPSMPAFGGQFLEPSMKVLVAYVRGFSDPVAEQTSDASPPADGAVP